jgi:hypothetical protein
VFDKLKSMLGIVTSTNTETKKTNDLTEPTNQNSSPAPKRTRKKKQKPTETVKELTAKEKATLANESYISIVNMELDPNDISSGSISFDWNDKFIINLIKSGYKKKPEDTDADLVDRWFTNLCRNVVLEIHEQYMADPSNRVLDGGRPDIKKRMIGDGKVELS